MSANGASRRRLTRSTAVLAVACAAGGLFGAGCSSSTPSHTAPSSSPSAIPSAQGSACKVGFALDNYEPERYLSWDGPAIEKVLDREGATYNMTDARANADRQASDIDTFVAAGTDVLIVKPVTYMTGGLPAAVKRATDAGIPVIAYDSYLENPKVLHIAFDWVEVGRMEARAILAARPAGDYAIIKGGASDGSIADMLRRGIGEVLQPALDSGAIKIVGESYTVNWDPFTAQGEMDAILKKNDNKIDAVVAEDDGLAAGVIKALTEAGLAGKVAVSGAGGFGGFPSVSNYNALARGVQTVDVWQDYRQLGRTAAEAAVALCRDPDIAKVSGTTLFSTPGGNQLTSILLTSTTITQDNLGVILDTGWIKKDELCRDVNPAAAPAACG